MRLLVLSDIHANWEALDAVLTASEGDYDGVLCLGDLVGYGPNPNECVDRVANLPNLTCLVGNHDWGALGRIDLNLFNGDARRAAEWTRDNMSPDVRAYLENLKPKLETELCALAHGSPRDPIWEYMTVEQQGPPNFEEFQAPFCFVGHTHVPRVFTNLNGGNKVSVALPDANDKISLKDGVRRIVNPGGVGQPRNGDPRAAYGFLNDETGEFIFRRINYDVPVTQQKIRDAGLPGVLATRLRLGL